MKKFSALTSACLLASSLCTGYAYAGGEEMPQDSSGQFGMSITNLYLKPGADNLVYAVHTKPLPVPDPSWTQETIQPGWQPTFAVGFNYIFPDQKDQIKLDWLYLNSVDSASNTATGSESVAPAYYFGPLAQNLRGTTANGSVQFNLNDVRLVFDHTFTINHYLQLDPFVGVGGAYLRQNINATFTGTSGIGDLPYNITSYNRSRFIGAGPRLGFSATGTFGEHFQLLTSFGGTVMAGTIASSTDFNSFGGVANPSPVQTSMANIIQTEVVPELDAKLAMAYTTAFQSGRSLSLEFGYLFSTYLNGINQVVPTALVPNAFNNGAIAVETSEQQQSNFDINGPYIKLSWLF